MNCTENGCTKPATKRGLCGSHYATYRRTNRFTTTPCAIEGCAKNAEAKGFCQMHYARFLRTGDPRKTLISPHGSQDGKCFVTDCERPRYSKGYCERHYRRMHDHGRISRVMPEKNQGKGWLDTNGYYRKNVNGKQVAIHRLVVEEMLGRPLLPAEHIHHINGNKLDNRPENLQVIDARSHAVLTFMNHAKVTPFCPNCACPNCKPTDTIS